MVMCQMPGLVKVVLDREQELVCHSVALGRVRHFNANPNDADQHGQKFGSIHDFIGQKAHAAAAEMAVANHFGEYSFVPSIENGNDKADVGNNIEVKWTKHEYGHLIIQNKPRVRTNDVAILVTGYGPVYWILGWMPVSMVMQPRYKHSHQNNYWVPRSSLFEMQYLKRSNYGEI